MAVMAEKAMKGKLRSYGCHDGGWSYGWGSREEVVAVIWLGWS